MVLIDEEPERQCSFRKLSGAFRMHPENSMWGQWPKSKDPAKKNKSHTPGEAEVEWQMRRAVMFHWEQEEGQGQEGWTGC